VLQVHRLLVRSWGGLEDGDRGVYLTLGAGEVVGRRLALLGCNLYADDLASLGVDAAVVDEVLGAGEDEGAVAGDARAAVGLVGENVEIEIVGGHPKALAAALHEALRHP
jgi:hypothetical protein